MTYEDRIRQHHQQMSKSFARLADYILDSYIHAALMTATELAHKVDVDAATVVRFAQRLGYKGFPELQVEIKDRVKQDLFIRPEQATDPESIPGVVSATLNQLGDAIEQARMLLDAEKVEDLVEQIGSSRRILVVPEGLGQAAAHNLVNLLEQGGFLVTAAQPGVNDLARTVSTATSDDLLLAIDVAGDSHLGRALAEANSLGVPTAAIVGAASYRSATEANLALAAQNQPNIGIGIVIVDALVYTLAEALRWRFKDRFAGADAAIEAMFERIQG